MNDRLNDTTLTIQERCLMILKELCLIRDADNQNGTDNYSDIIRTNNKLLTALIIESTEDK